MKKALHISLGGTLFTFEEDAYQRLESYLSSIKRRFQNTPSHEEIIADIENRIAEQLIDSKEKIITLASVEKIITIMGKVEDFDDNETAENRSAPTETKKKLYRSSEDVWIAGVCSGLAAYIGIDALWTRLAFILLTFGSGFGILLYIILWIIMPEAKTASQKLEMKGDPVTLETLKETVQERIDEAKEKRGHGPARLLALPIIIIGKAIRAIIGAIVPIIRIVTGIGLTLAAIAGMAGLVTATGFFLSDNILIANDLHIQSILPGSQHVLVLAGIGLAALIPLFFILLGGISLLTKKRIISTPVSLAILGVWFVSLLVSGFGGAKIAANYNSYVATSPDYQNVTTAINLGAPFNKLEIEDGLVIDIRTGSTTSMIATGRARDIDSIETLVENGTLHVKNKNMQEERICLFCSHRAPEISLTLPELLSLQARFGSRVNLEGVAKEFEATVEQGSRLDAEDFIAENTTIRATYGSRANINVSTSLNATAEYGSNIFYLGSPTLIKKETFGGRVEARE